MIIVAILLVQVLALMALLVVAIVKGDFKGGVKFSWMFDVFFSHKKNGKGADFGEYKFARFRL